MKFICLGYLDEEKWDGLSEREQAAVMDECFAFDDELREKGHFAGGEGLQSARKGVTLQHRNGKISITDGPFAETKEQLGGILVLEAKDLDHAVQLMSKHPGVRVGPFEIRPAEDMNPFIEASRKRRGAVTA
ncbi:MAG: YciI family protein [Gammaproteobacteria bacterium]